MNLRTRLSILVAGALAVAVAVAVAAPSPASARPMCDQPDPPPICLPRDRPPPPPPPNRAPIGHLDSVVSTPGGLRVTGWVIDPDSPGAASVAITVDRGLRLTVPATAHRPDVGAAYPGYGDAHGFDVVLPGTRRHTSVCAVGLDTASGPSSALGCGRDPRAFSVLDLNIAGLGEWWANDAGSGETYLPWRDRYARIASWMAATATLPDVITLQEAPARKEWLLPVPNTNPDDYEALVFLIESIKQRTGANYRIAYLAADYVHEGLQPLYQGRALIYNADRVRNTTALVGGVVMPPLDSTVTGVQMRASFPCRAPLRAGDCALLDLDGRHWMEAHMNPVGSRQWVRGAVAATFELITAPGRHVLVFNVHQHPDTDPGDAPGLRALIDAQWAAWRTRPALMPPIVAGDFNGDPELLGDFTTGGAEHIDVVLAGRPAAYPAELSPAAESLAVPTRLPGDPNLQGHCGTVATMLSDHCAVYVQYLPN